ncbi:hypothetical protein LSTR_LSTR008952 [Laodelphax striatellus]|uniref:Uncharacterized protein n=1 Tax=Laodelphax striatellus TaxID=195883 RepID=A0A482WJY8_LAOST|nr:hypothetical protein LSTR_LSTR008952 [Laodelphax striatellus]
MRYFSCSLFPVFYLAILVINYSGAVPLDLEEVENSEDETTQTDQPSCSELDAYKRIIELLAAQPEEYNTLVIQNIEKVEINGKQVDENCGDDVDENVDWEINRNHRAYIRPVSYVMSDGKGKGEEYDRRNEFGGRGGDFGQGRWKRSDFVWDKQEGEIPDLFREQKILSEPIFDEVVKKEVCDKIFELVNAYNKQGVVLTNEEMRGIQENRDESRKDK